MCFKTKLFDKHDFAYVSLKLSLCFCQTIHMFYSEIWRVNHVDMQDVYNLCLRLKDFSRKLLLWKQMCFKKRMFLERNEFQTKRYTIVDQVSVTLYSA